MQRIAKALAYTAVVVLSAALLALFELLPELSLVTTLVYLALMLILVPPYSYVGAALAFLGFAVIKSALSFAVFGHYMREHGKGSA